MAENKSMGESVKMKIYLCSRVAADARPLNDKVADALAAAGFEVFVPHRAPINNGSGASDAEIYTQDIGELNSSDIFVAVGRLGIDCAVESGIAMSKYIPIFHYVPEGTDLGWNPMFWKMHNECKYNDLNELVSDLVAWAKVDRRIGL